MQHKCKECDFECAAEIIMLRHKENHEEKRKREAEKNEVTKRINKQIR